MSDTENRGLPQNLILEHRKRLSISGVEAVDSFDESFVRMRTALGDLLVRGEGLHVDLLSVETGDALITGRVDELSYEDTVERRGLWERLFG